MKNLEEKFKAFLSDEKKTQIIAKDQAFLDAVSGGTATPETIAKEFEKAGLTLSNDEAKEIKETAEKALSTPLEKLENIELQNVSGGITDRTLCNISKVGYGVEATGVVGGIGLCVAGMVCIVQAAKAANAGNESKCKKLQRASIDLYAAGLAFVGVGALGGITANYTRNVLLNRVEHQRSDTLRGQEAHE